jgi:serine/threonine protein kinase
MADITEKLERLATLLGKGLITREEFDEEKARLRATARLSSTPPTASTNPGSSPNVGEELGAYRILGELGQGGMGVVVRGKHRIAAMAKRQGGEVAIKVLHAQYAQDEVFRDRFEREASMGLKLDHPGIVKVYDLVVGAGGTLAIAMELAEGRPLSEVIGEETGPIPWDRAWPMFKQMLDAVAYAHEHNVVHRDIKPENVIVSPSGRLKILDFGIAKDMEGGKTKTGTGMGTVNYMAPEQYTDAKSVDERADIYALGMTLYEMLAGRLPWEPGVTEFRILTVKSKGDFPPPTEFYPDIPPGVVQVVQKAVEVEKADRFTGVAAMSKALEEAGLAPVATAAKQPVAQQPVAQQPVAQQPVAQQPVAQQPVAQQPVAQQPPPVVSGTSNGTPEKSKGVSLLAVVLLFIGLLAVGIGSGLLGGSNDESGDQHYSEKTKVQPSKEKIIEDLGIVMEPFGVGSAFWMGSTPSMDFQRDSDESLHAVRLSRSFEMSATEVTQEQYAAVMGQDPVASRSRYWGSSPGGNADDPCRNYGLGGNYPVHCVSWFDAVEFANKLSAKAGLQPAYKIRGKKVDWDPDANGFRLPTEAEWAYAATGGGRSRGGGYIAGVDPNELCDYANVSNVATNRQFRNWTGRGVLPCDDGYASLAPVKSQKSVSGLFDMSGNLWEWVWDNYSKDLGTVHSSVQQDPNGGSASGEQSKVLRGGSWQGPAADYRIANRYLSLPDRHSYFVGFRMARNCASQDCAPNLGSKRKFEGGLPDQSWIVCVGASDSKKQAEKVAEKLLLKGFAASVVWIPEVSSFSGTRMWLTFAGPALAREDVKVLLSQVRRAGYRDAYGLHVNSLSQREEIR